MNEIEKLLFQHYIKPTRKRMLIAESLAGSESPVTAQELLEKVNDEIPVNKVTLYRALDLFEEKGMLIKHQAADRSFRYCFSGQVEEFHCHFLCTECGNMQCISPEDAGINPQAVQEHIHHLKRVEVRLDGVCSNCR